MIVVDHVVRYPISRDSFYSVIADVEHYTDVFDGVENVLIISRSDNMIVAELTLSWIKKVTYCLELHLTPNSSVSWKLASPSKILSKNEGSWHLKQIGNVVEVTYSLSLEFNGKVPDIIVKKLTAIQLPLMVDAIYKKAKISGV